MSVLMCPSFFVTIINRTGERLLIVTEDKSDKCKKKKGPHLPMQSFLMSFCNLSLTRLQEPQQSQRSRNRPGRSKNRSQRSNPLQH